MFKVIRNIDDVLPAVVNKKEIRFLSQPNGTTIGCYLFCDSKTFDSPESLECRGITFGRDGAVVSRPLHKFFNLGEKEWLSRDRLAGRDDICAVYEKLDGSMIATSLINGELAWRSKKSFSSDVVRLAEGFLSSSENRNISDFARDVSEAGMTAIFELTHPDARIVVRHDRPSLNLLHVRDNVTGEYVMLNKDHDIHGLIANYNVPMVRRYAGLSLDGAISTLSDMNNLEGYVIQFANGDMVKVKCPWYLRLHRSLSFLRERDIAMLAINEELDDVKGVLVEAGIDLEAVNQVESRLRGILSGIMDEVEAIYQCGRHLDRKGFAMANKGHPLFSLSMQRYLGKEVPLLDWYTHNRLKNDFSLRMLTDDLVAEALEG